MYNQQSPDIINFHPFVMLPPIFLTPSKQLIPYHTSLQNNHLHAFNPQSYFNPSSNNTNIDSQQYYLLSFKFVETQTPPTYSIISTYPLQTAIEPSSTTPKINTLFYNKIIFQYNGHLPSHHSLIISQYFISLTMTNSLKNSFFQSINQLTQSLSFTDMVMNPPHPGPRNTRKINDWNVFPCYNCAGDRPSVYQCDVCKGKGQLRGDHPMVKMIQQIIDSKFKGKQQKIGIEALSNALGKEQMTSSLEVQEIHRNYNCDGCGMHPITGKRFHCNVCKDYDLCSKCNDKKMHNHELQRAVIPTEYSPTKKIDKQTQKSMLFGLAKASITSSRLSR